MTDPLEKGFQEVTTHVVIYHVNALGGQKELYRYVSSTFVTVIVFCVHPSDFYRESHVVAVMCVCMCVTTRTDTSCAYTTARSSSCSERWSSSSACRSLRYKTCFEKVGDRLTDLQRTPCLPRCCSVNCAQLMGLSSLRKSKLSPKENSPRSQIPH